MSLYSRRGVSAQKEEVHAAVKNLDQGLFPHAFCKVYPDLLGSDENFVNIMHADGAGTKSILAYLYWKETGDISVWKGIAQDAIVMNLDDLDRSLIALAEVSPHHAQIVELRFMLGLTVQEAARASGIPERTVKRRWQAARVWLQDHLSVDGVANLA